MSSRTRVHWGRVFRTRVFRAGVFRARVRDPCFSNQRLSAVKYNCRFTEHAYYVRNMHAIPYGMGSARERIASWNFVPSFFTSFGRQRDRGGKDVVFTTTIIA